MMDWTSILGAVLGGASSGDAKQTTTADKTPWGPTQSWLTSNLGLGQSLQNSYMANPLSAAQQAAYNNSFATTGLGRSIAGRVIPQLSSTQFFDRTNPLNRPTPLSFVGGDTSGAGTNGSLGLGGGYMPTYAAPTVNTSGNGVAAIPTMANGYGNRGDGTGYQGPLTDRDFAAQKEMRDLAGGWSPYDKANFMSALPMIGGFLTGNPLAIAGGMASAYMTAPNAKSYTDNYNNMKDMQAAQQADEAALRQIVAEQQAQPAPESAPTYSWDRDSKSWVVGSSGGGGGSGHDYSGIGGDNVGGGVAANPMGRDPAQAQGGFAKGGMVRKKDLHGPDPKGPDEGKANLQSGEYVIKKAAVKKYGKGLLSDINNMKA